MPRGRALLSDKEQRILVQAQLMGLSTDSMVRIGNRLRALDKEREFKSKVDEVCSGFTWTAKDKRNFTITDSDGKTYEVSITKDYSDFRWNHGPKTYADVTISFPRSKKSRNIKKHSVTEDPWNEEIACACPDGNKFLYRMMRDIKNGRFK